MNVYRPHSFSFTEFLAGTPLDEQNKLARRDYLAYCYGTNKTFGEWYVALISDYLGLSWDTTVESVQRLSIYLRAYTIVDDDLRDVPQKTNQTCLQTLRRYFLDTAWIEVDKLCSNEVDATESLQTELGRYNHASDLYGRLHSKVISLPVEVSYTEKYADRMAMVRVPFRLLGSRCETDHALTNGLRGIECFMEALQIFDDLVDWEEDLKERRITYPIVSYLATLPKREAEDTAYCIFTRSPEDVEDRIRAIGQDLNFRHVIHEQLWLADRVLATAQDRFAQGPGNGLSKKTVDVRERLGRVMADTVPTSRDLISHLKCSGIAPVRSHLERGF